MDAGQLAALIAAGFFAVLACVGVVVLIRFARLVSAVTGMVTEYRDRADQLLAQAQAAVDRTNAQLARTDAITASMDQVTANMAELSGHVSALAGLARGISAAATKPLSGLSALTFGVRRAVVVRRSLQAATAAETLIASASRPAILSSVTDAPERPPRGQEQQRPGRSGRSQPSQQAERSRVQGSGR
jgi:Bacterial protein of unknown function (DUF948)